ncbi:MAG: hypothetical protein J5722_12360 [Oscillospiraceae bacterium]|nr:hypothetical protein [Oscillospiraceae bacterium]
MNKIWTGALVSLLLLMLFWFGFDLIENFEPIRFITSVYAAILFVCFLFTGIVKQIRKKASSYCIFAAVDFVIGIGVSVYSVYDIKFDTDEWFKGLLGTVLLVYVVPFIILLLIIDLILWKKRKSKQQL